MFFFGIGCILMGVFKFVLIKIMVESIIDVGLI